ncbi:hypothetical protein ACFOSC_21450 [Streptantibioticus rubrisoli]|uniref:Uncharacterized protein n=1 Tax=Streptantibioticus rubrisoli TaxID=1387313 RepID=A0ABT1P591_9ACTN|nr:hypothetical protein [Streptantibioticus rubrisoli]MCQ4040529.1 hypothetical protein [Streptantibioticus rubrisoli]
MASGRKPQSETSARAALGSAATRSGPQTATNSCTALIPLIARTGYIGPTAFVVNLLTAAALTVLLRALRAPQGGDETSPGVYRAVAGDPVAADAGEPEPIPLTVPAD